MPSLHQWQTIQWHINLWARTSEQRVGDSNLKCRVILHIPLEYLLAAPFWLILCWQLPLTLHRAIRLERFILTSPALSTHMHYWYHFPLFFFLLCCYLECPCSYQSQGHHTLFPGWSHFFLSSQNFASIVLPSFFYIINSSYSTGLFLSILYLKSHTKHPIKCLLGVLRFCFIPKACSSALGWYNAFCNSHPRRLDTVCFDKMQGVLQIMLPLIFVILKFVVGLLVQLVYKWS